LPENESADNAAIAKMAVAMTHRGNDSLLIFILLLNLSFFEWLQFLSNKSKTCYQSINLKKPV
jgi:hypothetical protein